MARISALSVLLLIAGTLSGHLVNGQADSTPATASEITTTAASETTTPVITTAAETTAVAETTTRPVTTTAAETTTSVAETTASAAGTTGPTTSLILETTTAVGHVTTSAKACPSNAAAGRANCASINGIDDLNRLLASGEDMSYCSFSMQQYGCAQIGTLPLDKATNITSCFLQDEAIITPESCALYISGLSTDNFKGILDWMATTGHALPPATKSLFLGSCLERLGTDPEMQNPAVVGSWFQKLSPLLDSVSAENFDCMLSYPTSCEGQKNIMSVLDLQYTKVSNDTRRNTSIYASKFLNSRSCISGSLSQAIPGFYGQYFNDADYPDLEVAFHNMDLSSAVSVLNGRQLVQYVQTTKAFSSYSSASTVLTVLESKDFSFNLEVLITLPESEYISSDVMYWLADNIMTKQEQVTDPLCKPQKKAIFQGKFNYIFQTVNQTMMDRIKPADCSEIRDIFDGFDLIDDKLNENQKVLVAGQRYKYLKAEADKAGSGCTYGYISETWLINMVGLSKSYWSYADFMVVNPQFDGFSVIGSLTSNQTCDMVISSGLFTDPSPTDAESRVGILTDNLRTKGYDYTNEWLLTLNKKQSVKVIKNITVRVRFLTGIWGILETRFSSFTENDWDTLFNQQISLASSSITKEQLSLLPADVVKGCSNLQTIMQGFNTNYDDMNSDSVNDVVDWATSILRSEPSHCISGDGDWLASNYRRFRVNIKIRVITELNLGYLESNYGSLSSSQCGEFLARYPPAHTDVKYAQTIFSNLRNGTREQNLKEIGAFWDSFVEADVKASDITKEVKSFMLSETLSELSPVMTSLNSVEIRLWLNIRIKLVLIELTSENLKAFPSNPGCDFQKTFVSAASSVREDASNTSQLAVADYINKVLDNDAKLKPQDERCAAKETTTAGFIRNYMANYSYSASYRQMTGYYQGFNVRESGVLGLLSADQTGEMMLAEKVLESKEKVDWVFTYMKTTNYEFTNQVMTKMTETYIQENGTITEEAAQSISEQYLQIIQPQLSAYTADDTQELLEKRMFVMLPYVTQTVLASIPVKNCNTLKKFVGVLDRQYTKMVPSTRQTVAKWSLGVLRSNSLRGCSSDSTSSADWINSNTKRFFQDVTLKEVQEVFSLDVMEVISITSVTQKAEFVTSSPEAMTNVNVTRAVLDTIPVEDKATSMQRMFGFLQSFNNNFGANAASTMTREVKAEITDFTFSHYSVAFGGTAEVSNELPTLMRNVIGSISVDTIKKLPKYNDCNTFRNTFATLNVGFSQMSEAVSVVASQNLIDSLSSISSASGSSPDTCSSLYSDSKTYMLNIFFSFRRYISFNYFQMFYTRFDAYSCLDLLTANHMGNLLANSTALTDEIKTSQIVVELQKRNKQEVKDCMKEVKRVVKEKKINKLPDANVQRVLNNVVWSSMEQTDYSFWFGEGIIEPFITSSTPTQIQSLSKNTDCNSQRGIVDSFSFSYNDLSAEQTLAVFNVIMEVNTQILASTGSPCPAESESESGTISVWLKLTFNAFAPMATLAQFKQLNSNFSADEVLPQLSGPQKADYVIESGALQDVNLMSSIINKAENFFKENSLFFSTINTKAGPQLKSSPAGDLILNKSFEAQSPNFHSYKADNYKTLFQEDYKYVLHHISAEELKRMPLPMDCSSYTEVVIGFNNVFESMTKDSQALVYNQFIKAQLDLTEAVEGVKCGHSTDTVEIWMERTCGKFRIYGETADFSLWNTNYNAMNMLNTLSPIQAAKVAVTVINNEAAACQVAGRVEQFNVDGTYEFLDSFSLSLAQINLKAASKPALNKFLGSSLKVISASFVKYTYQDWDLLITKRYKSLLSTADSQQLSTILDSTDCQSYSLVVSELSAGYEGLSETERADTYKVLSDHVKGKKGSSGFCVEAGEGSNATLKRLFGAFSGYCPFSEMVSVIPGFNWVQAADSLSPPQLANATFETGALSNPEEAEVLNATLTKFTPDEMFLYLKTAKLSSDAKNIQSLPDKTIGGMLYKTIANKMSSRYNVFTDMDWNNYMSYTDLFLPNIEAEQVNQIPPNIGCGALQTIVRYTGRHYEQMLGPSQWAMSDKIRTVLEAQKAATGSACLANTGNSGKWIDVYWSYFSETQQLTTFLALNPGFSVREALPSLTPEQLASYTADPSVLADMNNIDHILTSMSSTNIGFFLTEFNLNMKTKGITGIPNAQVRKFFLGSVFCKYASKFLSFTAPDYQVFFSESLEYLLPSVDAKCFGFVPDDLTCDSLANIMGAVNRVKNLEHPNAAYDFAMSRLNAIKLSTGDACVGSNDSNIWISTYIGPLASQGEYSAFTSLNPKFNAVVVTSLMSSKQLADAFTSSSSITSNAESMNIVLNAVSSDLTSFKSFMSTVRTNALSNPSVTLSSSMKRALLNVAVSNVFTRFSTMSAAEVGSWMSSLSFVFSSLNGTHMEHVPTSIPCENLAAMVSALDAEFLTFREQQRKEIADGIFNILNAKSSDGSCVNGFGIFQWISKFLSQYCLYISSGKLAPLFPSFNAVSYEEIQKVYSTSITTITVITSVVSAP